MTANMLSFCMRITLDTNVLYQALRNRTGASFYILQLIRNREIELAISVPVYLEYQDVLHRPKSLKDLKLMRADIDAVLRLIAYVSRSFDIHFLMRPNLSDENDNMFADLAVASNSQYLVTNNISDFVHNVNLRFDSFEIVTPRAFVKTWRRNYE